jgi:hypothetical protein
MFLSSLNYSWNEERPKREGDVPPATAAECAAFAIQGVLSRSPDLPPDVISWARSLNERFDLAWPPIFQDWWIKNEKAVREKRYKDVIPGKPIAPLKPRPKPSRAHGDSEDCTARSWCSARSSHEYHAPL